MAAIQKNILEHISLMAQEQVQLEFREQMMHIKCYNNRQQTIHKPATDVQQIHNKLKQEKQC